MNTWMTPDFGRILTFLGIGIVSFSMLIGLLASRIRRSFKPLSKRAVYYLLIALLPFALTAWLASVKPLESYLGSFIISQVLMVLFGSLHLYFMERKLPWGHDQSFWSDFLYTFLIMIVGALIYMMTFRWKNKEGIELYMIASVLFFAVPLFLTYTFRRAMDIPPKLFKQWFYPVHQPVEDPDESQLKNLLLISFEFQKTGADTYFTNFRAKAPVDMDFGALFYYFINDYNERHPLGHINYVNPTGEPNGWMFYKKPKWYTVLTRYIDADRTIFMNSIRENDVIVCVRTH